MDKEELKLYLKIDSVDEDVLLKILIESAEEKLLEAGIKKDYERALYKLAVLMLVAHWYTNRGIVSEDRVEQHEMPQGITGIIFTLQLSQKQEVSDEN